MTLGVIFWLFQLILDERLIVLERCLGIVVSNTVAKLPLKCRLSACRRHPALVCVETVCVDCPKHWHSQQMTL